jgi:glucose-6-phosphate 1-epimerase
MQTNSTVSQGRHGELDTLVVDNEHAKIELTLFGAQILSFVPKHDGRERLWLSPHASLTGEKPIRGGIPICWPWFGNDTGQEDEHLPSHGFLRTQNWTLQNSDDAEDGTELTLVPSFTAYKQFDIVLDVSLKIKVGSALTVSLTTQNKDVKSMTFNTALHTYFSVEGVSQCELMGIEGDFKDKLDNWEIKTTPFPYTINSETDRIHLSTALNTQIKGLNGTTLIEHQNHDSIVVWNPWTSAASMPDMDAFGYKNMLCVETAVTQWKELKPGESHTLTQRIS